MKYNTNMKLINSKFNHDNFFSEIVPKYWQWVLERKSWDCKGQNIYIVMYILEEICISWGWKKYKIHSTNLIPDS